MEQNTYRPILFEPFAEKERLINLYREASDAYYNSGDTIMSDENFDNLRNQLLNLGVDLSQVGAPTKSGNKRQHTYPMLSLGKVSVKSQTFEPCYYNDIISELKRYQDNVDDNTKVLISWKLDGCGIDLLYEGGLLIDAITRGDGTTGQSVYAKMRSRLPLKLDNNFTGSVRGEFVMKKQTFVDKYTDEYKNPRNLVAGILSDQNLNDNRIEDVDVVLYSINGIWQVSEKFEWDPETQTYGGIPLKMVHNAYEIELNQLPQEYALHQSIRNSFEYPTDGIVIQIKDPQHGFIGDSHEPYHMIAIKFPPMKVKTTVKYVELNLRKSGEYVPKLILEPVDVDGSTVSQCAAFNWGYIMEYGLLPGAEIEIGKNGDIIPYVQSIIKPASYENCHVVSHISGNAEIVTGEGDKLPKNSYISGIHCFTLDVNSPKVRKERFILQCSRLEIKGFGWSTFNSLFEMVNGDFIELFNPIYMQDAILEEYIPGNATRQKWIRGLKSIKEKMTLYWFIGMMSFPNCGWAIAEQAARKASHVDYDFSGLDKSVIDNLFNGEYAKELSIAIKKFKEYGGHIEPYRVEVKEYEATYEMTGSPNVEGFKTKEDIQRKLYKWEHTPLTKTTKYLVTNDKNSKTNKMKKAEANGTVILTYAEAIALHDSK